METSVLNTTIYIAFVQIFNIIFSHSHPYFKSERSAKNVAYSCASFNVTDPDWDLQWSLKGDESVPVDMNVMHAWRQCYNGSGVTVAIVDDGLYDHPDLNINRSLDADINHLIPASRSHGTQVAGIVAAKRNSNCGIGIAFEATLADIRIITGLIEPASKMGQILTSHLDKIDIYSNSYTNPTLWALVHNTAKEVLQALQTGTSQGRNGKGAIYVWSTGNGGAPPYPFGCAYEGLNNNPYVIPVAGVRWNYNKLTSGDSCSSIMVAAFSRQTGDQDYRIVTTSGAASGCEHYFGRNSAAVPVVSGAIALALQANPTLSYRDIMHLLVNTSNANLEFNPKDFIINYAGIKVSKTFGFGLLDIGRLVDMAKVWKNVKPRIMCNYWRNISCSLRSNRTVMVENCKITSLEHVEIYFNVESIRAGQLRLDLVSPSGTVSNMVPGRQLDQRHSLNLTVTSVHFWGEASTGNWTLHPSDFSNNLGFINGTMLEFQLKLYGINEYSLHTTPLTTKGYVSTTSDEGKDTTQQHETSSHTSVIVDTSSHVSGLDSTIQLDTSVPTSAINHSTTRQQINTSFHPSIITDSSTTFTSMTFETSTEENCDGIVNDSRDLAAEVGIPIAIILPSVLVPLFVIFVIILLIRQNKLLFGKCIFKRSSINRKVSSNNFEL